VPGRSIKGTFPDRATFARIQCTVGDAVTEAGRFQLLRAIGRRFTGAADDQISHSACRCRPERALVIFRKYGAFEVDAGVRLAGGTLEGAVGRAAFVTLSVGGTRLAGPIATHRHDLSAGLRGAAIDGTVAPAFVTIANTVSTHRATGDTRTCAVPTVATAAPHDGHQHEQDREATQAGRGRHRAARTDSLRLCQRHRVHRCHVVH